MQVHVDYDILWEDSYGELQEIGPVHRHTARMIVDTIRPLGIRSILDVGCGNGANLKAIQDELDIRDVVGVDVSDTALSVARRRVQGEFRVLNAVEETLDRTFDLVLSSQVIEHVEDDDAFLANIRRMCGKYAFIGTMQGQMRRSEPKYGHYRNYSRRGLEEKMQRAGFAIEHVIEWGFPFYSPLYRTLIEYVPDQAMKNSYGARDRFLASVLYQLYRFNTSKRGDILMILGRAV